MRLTHLMRNVSTLAPKYTREIRNGLPFGGGRAYTIFWRLSASGEKMSPVNDQFVAHLLEFEPRRGLAFHRYYPVDNHPTMPQGCR